MKIARLLKDGKETYGIIKNDKVATRQSITYETGVPLPLSIRDFLFDGWYNEIENRRKNVKTPQLKNQTPWQEISRSMVGQLETGACLETESLYLDITKTKGMPRHSH